MSDIGLNDRRAMIYGNNGGKDLNVEVEQWVGINTNIWDLIPVQDSSNENITVKSTSPFFEESVYP